MQRRQHHTTLNSTQLSQSTPSAARPRLPPPRIRNDPPLNRKKSSRLSPPLSASPQKGGAPLLRPPPRHHHGAVTAGGLARHGGDCRAPRIGRRARARCVFPSSSSSLFPFAAKERGRGGVFPLCLRFRAATTRLDERHRRVKARALYSASAHSGGGARARVRSAPRVKNKSRSLPLSLPHPTKQPSRTFAPRTTTTGDDGIPSMSAVSKAGGAGHALQFRDHIVLKKDFKVRVQALARDVAAAHRPTDDSPPSALASRRPPPKTNPRKPTTKTKHQTPNTKPNNQTPNNKLKRTSPRPPSPLRRGSPRRTFATRAPS